MTDKLNIQIKNGEFIVSDGHHTFDELYEHRITIYIALCSVMAEYKQTPWISRLHSDGTHYEGWFIMGIGMLKGEQITYHLPMKYWDECYQFADVREKAPEWDGHTSADVLKRLSQLSKDNS